MLLHTGTEAEKRKVRCRWCLQRRRWCICPCCGAPVKVIHIQ